MPSAAGSAAGGVETGSLVQQVALGGVGINDALILTREVFYRDFRNLGSTG